MLFKLNLTRFQKKFKAFNLIVFYLTLLHAQPLYFNEKNQKMYKIDSLKGRFF